MSAPGGGQPRARARGRARATACLLALALVVLGLGAGAQGVLRALAPGLAVDAAALSGWERFNASKVTRMRAAPEELVQTWREVVIDPWGRPFLQREVPRRHGNSPPSHPLSVCIGRGSLLVMYSAGPNGRDDRGGADEVDVSWEVGAPRPLWQIELALRARLLTLLVALTLAAWALAVGAPRQTGPREGLLVVAVSVPLSLLGTIALDAVLAAPTLRERLPASDFALVAPEDALRATWALVVLLASTGLRFACRPLERSEDPAPGEPDAA